MKVYIAHDDVNLVGVYESWMAARNALVEAAQGYCEQYALDGPLRFARWRDEDGTVIRLAACDGNEWEQWYVAHEVQP